MRNKMVRGTCAFALAVVLLFSSTGVFAKDDAWVDDEPVAASGNEYKDQLDDLTVKLQNIKKEQETLKKQLASTQTEMGKKLVEKAQWQGKIDLAKSEIAILEERIAVLEKQIEDKLTEIDGKQTEINFNFEQYKKRLRASYLAGESSALSMVLGSTDFTDFLMRSEFVSATARHDKELLAQLRTQQAELEAAKISYESSKKAVEQDALEMQQKKKELETELSETEGEIEDISLLEKAYRADAAKLAAQDKLVQAELDKVYAKIDNTGAFVGGVFGWPVPNYSTITSYFGWRFNNTNFHTGIDIAGSGIFGKSVKASNSGTVAFIQNSYKDGVGYGRHVIVNHGGGYTTLYAHMSSISVSVGDTVTRGVSEIGKIGSTGWSTGPHLHFEVRIGGKAQNPLGYLKSKG